jgi:hypothetical protein
MKINSIVSSRISLFLTGFLQVMFIAMNTVFISKSMIIPMVVSGFLISIIWTLNVKKVVFGEWIDRIIYATGASIGTIIGYFLANFITTMI